MIARSTKLCGRWGSTSKMSWWIVLFLTSVMVVEALTVSRRFFREAVSEEDSVMVLF